MGLIVYVFKTTTDCSNDGLSSKFDRLCLVNVEGPSQPSANCPAIMLKKMVNGSHGTHVYAVPVEKSKSWWQHGGSFTKPAVAGIDEALRLMGGIRSVAIQLHDRQE